MSSVVQVFAKAPQLGKVKTRVAEDLGHEKALMLHQWLCEAAITVAQASPADVVEIWVAHDDDTNLVDHLGFFEQFGVPLYQQQGKELGTRMDFSLRHGLARHGQVVIVGADVYALTPYYITQALESLQNVDVVIGPTEDGGYGLLGACRSLPELFKKIPWGSDDVFAETLSRMLNNAMNFKVLNEIWDIDTVADLKQHAPELFNKLMVL